MTSPATPARTTLELVVPVYNEAVDLAASVRRLHDHLLQSMPFSWLITIADNASTDDTFRIARGLEQELSGVRATRLELKGRGRALKAIWATSQADVLAYTDVDLSTDLRALLPLIAPLISGHSDLAIGTRLARGSRVTRGPKRELISRGYNLLLKGALAASFSDAQCGFKAVRREVARRLLPLIEDDNWFFDTELLVLAQRSGLRIHEVPVDWVDDPDSRVDIIATALEDLRGIVRLAGGLLTGGIPVRRIGAELLASRPVPASAGLLAQLIRFGAVGVLSTVAYFVIYLLLRDPLGPQTANLVALLITAIGNTATNRRMTFGIQGRRRMLAHHAGGLAAFGFGLLLTSGSLWLLHTVIPGVSRTVEVIVLIFANALGTVVRFLTLRRLMTRPTVAQPSDTMPNPGP